MEARKIPWGVVPSLNYQKVSVYKNLTKKCFSVKCRGRVVSHLDTIALRSVSFRVNEKARDRVRITGHKTVHATVDGIWVQNHLIDLDKLFEKGIRVSYNPKKDDFFHIEGRDRRLVHANLVVLVQGAIYLVLDKDIKEILRGS